MIPISLYIEKETIFLDCSHYLIQDGNHANKGGGIWILTINHITHHLRNIVTIAVRIEYFQSFTALSIKTNLHVIIECKYKIHSNILQGENKQQNNVEVGWVCDIMHLQDTMPSLLQTHSNALDATAKGGNLHKALRSKVGRSSQ